MRVVAILALAGCSFQGSTSMPGTPDGNTPTMPDARTPDAHVTPDASPPDAAIDAAIDAPPPFVCPPDYAPITNGELGSTYKIYGYSSSPQADESRTFAEARMTCSAVGAFLAVPINFTEYDAINKAVPQRPGNPYFWIGLTDAANEGTWMTVLDTTAPYIKWGSGEPDGGSNANCMLGFDTGGTNWGMYDSACGLSEPFACECRD
jgi:hypothetical protein